MDIDEAKEFAGDHVITALCSGRDFKGLGLLARYLVVAVAGPANENALHISESTTRTPEAFVAMQKKAQEDFVTGILGFGDTKYTPVEAAEILVETVWHAYIDWAKEA